MTGEMSPERLDEVLTHVAGSRLRARPGVLEALDAVPQGRHVACHGVWADEDPERYAACVLHDAYPGLPLPAGAR